MDWSKYITGNVSLIDDLKKLMNPVTSTLTAPLDKLKRAVSAWFKDYNDLIAIPDSSLSPELIREKRRLIKEGQGIISKVKLLGFAGDRASDNMGFVPIIAGGVIAASAALIYYWTIDLVKFKDRMLEYQTLKKAGHSAAAASSIVNNVTSPPSFLSRIENVSKYALLGGAGLLGYYFFKRRG